MICEKITGEPRDFAFVDYFTVEEAAMVINSLKRNPMKIRGMPINVTYSKIRKPEDLRVKLRIILGSER
jgi:hypothetical protein